MRPTPPSICCRPPDGATAAFGPGVPARRTVLKAALGFGLCFSFLDVLPAGADEPRTARPREGDQFVFPPGEREGQIITPKDLPLGGPQQTAYPMDPGTKVVRDGSALNEVVLIRLDPASLTDDTREHAAEAVVAYSAVCTHQQCSVSMWQAQAKTLFCSCHGSQFDPRPGRRRTGSSPAPDAASHAARTPRIERSSNAVMESVFVHSPTRPALKRESRW